MAEDIKALYYPDFFVDPRTLVKAILLFDEIHFMDRPSITFTQGGQFGTIGAESPIRQFERSFRENGVPLYVHKPYSGPIDDRWYESVKADLRDPSFLRAFVEGLRDSETFRNLMIAKGNYGEIGTEADVLREYLSVDLDQVEKVGGALAIFEDDDIRHMDLSNDMGRAKSLIATAAICAAKLNFALSAGVDEGFSPLADARPFGALLSTKYRRAIRALPSSSNIHVTDLCFAILDGLLSKERINTLTIREAVEYRKASSEPRRAFLQHVKLLQTKSGKIDENGDYAAVISRIVETDVIPAARDYRNALKTIDEKLVGDLAKGAVGAVGGGSFIQLFGDLSLAHVVPLAGIISAYLAKSLIDNILASRSAERQCSLSYILSLD